MPGIVSFSGWRSRSENRRVPGMRPSKATGGSAARRINSTSEMTAPIATPRSKPCPSTPNMATIAMTNSRPSLRQRCLRADTLTRLATATNTTAANTGWGNALSSCEKKSTTTRMNTAAMAPDSGVRAPPPSLTTDCDMPPLTGKPWPNPAARLDAPSARNSWLASSRRSYLAANVRPMAAVSTAASRKHAKARGNIAFRSSQ